MGACLAESAYRPCGPVPCFIAPLGFFIHASMVCAPCTVCCAYPCQIADAARAHSATLHVSTLHVRTEAHALPTRPLMLCGNHAESGYSIIRSEDYFPLTELHEVAVLPPQPYGLNGWCHTLVVRDVSGVVICAVDHRNPTTLASFAQELRDAIAAGACLPPQPAISSQSPRAGARRGAPARLHERPPPCRLCAVHDES